VQRPAATYTYPIHLRPNGPGNSPYGLYGIRAFRGIWGHRNDARDNGRSYLSGRLGFYPIPCRLETGSFAKISR
jgi:hypothetical protein